MRDRFFVKGPRPEYKYQKHRRYRNGFVHYEYGNNFKHCLNPTYLRIFRNHEGRHPTGKPHKDYFVKRVRQGLLNNLSRSYLPTPLNFCK